MCHYLPFKLHKVLRQNSNTLKVLHQRKSLGNPGIKEQHGGCAKIFFCFMAITKEPFELGMWDDIHSVNIVGNEILTMSVKSNIFSDVMPCVLVQVTDVSAHHIGFLCLLPASCFLSAW
jgi:hypothetical protein